MKKNQKGVTLIEVLTALVLVSVIAVVAWTSLSIGFKHTAVETRKTLIQQDANLIISTLTGVHRQSASYSLIFEANKLKVVSCVDAVACNDNVIEKSYDFTGTMVNNIVIDSHDSVPDVISDLEPEKNHTVVKLVLTDLNNPKNTITVETTLTRILTSMN
ncbi:type II secretion system protein [Planococcus sp. ISL-110]|uniref:type II secretion system protein n=1 Tax=Planococcus sp. ISL-110 TaxID=2819167 RepID=UPI001BE51C8F|nr:type II secretion system protein [Planococcus sp. ISL-110]MBT2569184.1 prepilin-type N-terminal cleavage/methylation domain-containing protein [Planococcus sp. ISL-110]